MFVPCWKGNIRVKWLIQLKLLNGPAKFRDETSKYTDPLPDRSARQFTFPMETKSLITSPSGEMTLPRAGIYKITGLAWSGSGSIRGVEGLDGQFSEGVSYPFIFRMIRADRLVDLGIIFAYFSIKHKKPVARRNSSH